MYITKPIFDSLRQEFKSRGVKVVNATNKEFSVEFVCRDDNLRDEIFNDMLTEEAIDYDYNDATGVCTYTVYLNAWGVSEVEQILDRLDDYYDKNIGEAYV